MFMPQPRRVTIALYVNVIEDKAEPCAPVDRLRYRHRLDEEIKWNVCLRRCALPRTGDAERLLLDTAADERQADHIVAVEHHVEAVVASHLATQPNHFARASFDHSHLCNMLCDRQRDLTAANGTMVAPNLAAIRTNSELAGQKSL